MRARLAHQAPNQIAAAVRAAARHAVLHLRGARKRVARPARRAFLFLRVRVGRRHGREERRALRLRARLRVGRLGAHAATVGPLVARLVERRSAHGDLGVPASARALHAQVLVAVIVGGLALPRRSHAASRATRRRRRRRRREGIREGGREGAQVGRDRAAERRAAGRGSSSSSTRTGAQLPGRRAEPEAAQEPRGGRARAGRRSHCTRLALARRCTTPRGECANLVPQFGLQRCLQRTAFHMTNRLETRDEDQQSI